MYNLPIAAALSMAIAMPIVACDPPSSSGEIHISAPQITLSRASATAPVTILTGNALAFSRDDDSTSEITIHSNDNGNTVEIHIRNDDVTAKVNGKEVPADRIERDDNQIKILDEDGNVVYSSDLVFGIGNNAFRGFAFTPNGDDPLGNAYTTWLADASVAFEPPKVMLGVHMDSTGPALEKQLHLEPGTTTLISGVYEKLPANLAGIQEYDIIVSIEGADKADPQSVRDVLRNKDVGETIGMDIIQAGERKHVSVTLEKYDAERMMATTLLGSADEDISVWGPSGPGRLSNIWINKLPDGANVGVIGPQQRLRLREAPIAAAEALRNNYGRFHFDNQEMQRQMEEMQAQMERLQEMVRQMMPPEPPPAGHSEPRPLKPNES